MMPRATLAILAVVAFVARLLPGTRTVDDAFITFRYSRNLVEGNGFVYNIGERVLGTTTPLYASLMALLGGLLGGDYPTYALVVNALAGALGVVLLTLIAYHFTESEGLAIGAGLIWSLSAPSVTFAIGGMETAVHNLFMLGAWWAYLADRRKWVGAACALGVLTRPDALLWALPLLAHQMWRSWRGRQAGASLWQWLPLDTWLVGLAVYTPWLLVSAAYFGSPIPQTVGAKANTYHIDEMQALIVFFQWVAVPLGAEMLLGAPAVAVGLVLFPALALIGWRATAAEDGRAMPIFIYPWIYIAIFVAVNPLIFRWYVVPPRPAYILAIVCGVAGLLKLIEGISARQRRAILAGLGVLVVIFGLSAWELEPDHGHKRPAPRMAFHELELNYKTMALRLRSQYGVDEDTVLAAGDIGAIGYYSRAHIFDTIGLVTEGNDAYYADRAALEAILVDDQNYVIPPDLLLDAEPDYVVVMEGFIRLGLAQDERFQDAYREIEFIPTDYYGTGMQAFQRNELTNGED